MMMHATIKFSPSNIATLKKALRNQYPKVRSSHADEALAASFGFKSYAAMLAVLNQVSGSARLMVQSDPCLLLLRLDQLGYSGLSLQALRRLTWEVPYPDRWQDDELQQALNGRFAPVAANSDAVPS